MKHLSILALVLASCASPEGLQTEIEKPVAVMSERCKSCGTEHHYASSFDAQDYALIAGFCDAFKLKREVYWKAPRHSCSSKLATEFPWETLRDKMPDLKRETYQSFLQRNEPVPMHRGSENMAAQHGITIKRSGSGLQHFSRGGFSKDGKQALIDAGDGIIYLFEYLGQTWQQVDKVVIWIS
ncbi:hypothetical protein SAMN02745181_0275 [Rubritalea squalenifaciens DSM 18772]|uniref:Uncharacterized protein n=1 Tax=Rubritalea squalenifaciens DSM 18772 TaxID=1123071 RepID=A0A1M6BPD2_9BACT|nr:hypothetical protein [Rubritalea squalenifaciens]SHI50566.1 hypothetical protein SAMN02745181_0275 [Rubritalea squalenifaciens DSM 18772]